MNTANNGERFENHTKRLCMPMCERRIFTDVTNDYTLPDYQAEIRRVLNVSTLVSPPAKYISMNGAEFSGNIDYNILYVSNDGELYSMSLPAEYSFTAPIDSDGFDFNEAVSSCCDTNMDSVGVRLLGPRKVNIKSRANSLVRVWGYKVFDVKSCGDATIDSIQTFEKKLNNVRVLRTISEDIELSDETYIPESNVRVISADGCVSVKSINIKPDEAEVSGVVNFKLIYSNLDIPGKINVVSKTIPFSEVLEADGLNVSALCVSKGNISNIAISVEEGRIVSDITMVLTLEAQSNEEISCVSDMYSTDYNSKCFYRDHCVQGIGYAENGNFSMNEKLARESIGISSDAEIIDVYGVASVETNEKIDDKMEIRGNVKYNLILRSNDEYSSLEVLLPVKYVFECTLDNLMSPLSEMSVLSCSARLDNDNVSIDAEISVMSMSTSKENVMLIDEVEFTGEVKKEKGTITVCYPGSDDDLWSIAKRYHVPVSSIEAINDTLENPKYILI